MAAIVLIEVIRNILTDDNRIEYKREYDEYISSGRTKSLRTNISISGINFVRLNINRKSGYNIIGWELIDTINNNFYYFGYDETFENVFWLSEILNTGLKFGNYQIMPFEEFKNNDDMELLLLDHTGILRRSIQF